MTKRTTKTDKPLDAQALQRDALAATVAMGKMLPADDGDPAHQPIKDWSTIRPDWCSVDDVLDYIAEHGRRDIPRDLIDAVMKRTYGPEDDDSFDDEPSAFLANLALMAAKRANSVNYALNMLSTTLSNEIEKDAVGELCDQIEVHLGEVIEMTAELDRRKLSEARS